MSEIDFTKLPNFFLIGATKSGTTSLHDTLDQHPMVYCSKVKEPCFFSIDARYTRGVAWYQETHFRNAGKFPRRGESSSTYLYWSSVVAGRIKESYSEREVKYIAILRDPVERAYSHYWMKVHRGLEKRSFAEALAAEEECLKDNWDRLRRNGSSQYGYYRGGCYATLLQPFLEIFPSDAFSLILLEDFQNNFAVTMAGLADFLDVHPDFEFHDVQSNPASQPRDPELHRFLHRPSGLLHKLIKPFTHRMSYTFRHKLKNALIEANMRQVSNPAMDPEMEHDLRIRYQGEIERLELIMGRDLSAWKAA